MSRQRIVVVVLFFSSSLLVGLFASYAVAYGIDRASSLSTVATLLAGVVSGSIGIWRAIAARPATRVRPDGPIASGQTRVRAAAGLALVVVVGLVAGTAVTAATAGRGRLDGLYAGPGRPGPDAVRSDGSDTPRSSTPSVTPSPSASSITLETGGSTSPATPTIGIADRVRTTSPADRTPAGPTGRAGVSARIVNPTAGSTTGERFIQVTAVAPAPTKGHFWYVVVQPGDQAGSHYFYPTALVSTNMYRASQTGLGPAKLSAGVAFVEFSVQLADVTAAGDQEIRQHWASDAAYNTSGMDHLPPATALAHTIMVRRTA